jgi:hypothetical protein
MGNFIASWWWLILVVVLAGLVYLRARWRAESSRPEPDVGSEPPKQPPAQ